MFKAPLVKADSIVPPSFTAFYVGGRCEACEFDVEKAKKWASDGGLTPGTTVSLSYNEDGGHKVSVEAMAAQIEENLGIDVDIQPVAKFRDSIERRSIPRRAAFSASRSAGYPTPSGLLGPLLLSTSGDNLAGYSNPAFDEQMELASQRRTTRLARSPSWKPSRSRSTTWRSSALVPDAVPGLGLRQVDGRGGGLLREPDIADIQGEVNDCTAPDRCGATSSAVSCSRV